jgi:hypothetical protein
VGRLELYQADTSLEQVQREKKCRLDVFTGKTVEVLYDEV